jgi:DNA repair exonuclease SbcCD ATPase subunit
MLGHEEKIKTLEDKNSGHRAKIDEKRNETEALLKAESVPQCMLDLLGPGGQNIIQERQLVTELVAKFTGPIPGAEFTGLIEEYKKLGWLEGIEAMAKKNIKTQEKITKNQERITECRDRIKKYEAEISSARLDLKRREVLEREGRKLDEEIQVLAFDKDIWLCNKGHNELIAGWRTQLEELDNQLGELMVTDKKRVQVTEALLSLAELELKRKELKAKIQSMQTIGTGLEDLITKADTNTKLQETIIQSMNEMSGINKRLAQVNGDIEVTREQIAGFRIQLDKMRAECNTKIETEKMMNLYAIYRDVMKQIPFRLISQVKDILERKVNDLLTVVTNFSVKFEISDSNIDIYLDRPVYEGRSILINNSSGFERFISSLAIRIALMEISQLPSPNFMAIDEGWSCFDNENINNIDVILDHLGQKFEFILTISHLQVIRQHCDTQLALRRGDDGFSYVTF